MKKIIVIGINGKYIRWANVKGTQITECSKCGFKIAGENASGEMEKHLSKHNKVSYSG